MHNESKWRHLNQLTNLISWRHHFENSLTFTLIFYVALEKMVHLKHYLL